MVGDPWRDDAAKMRNDVAARKLNGPLWLPFTDLWSLGAHTDPTGVATLVALCAGEHAAAVDEFLARLHRPRPGGKGSMKAFVAGWTPPCRDAAAPLTPDADVLAWVGEDTSRRLWAVVSIVWGLTTTELVEAFDELVAIDARPRALDVPDVSELAHAPAQRIPSLLMQAAPLDEVCAAFATALGLPASSPLETALPAALAATTAALAADRTVGVAACARLIRARTIGAVTPDTLVRTTRAGTAAHALGELLARLWERAVHDEEPAAGPG